MTNNSDKITEFLAFDQIPAGLQPKDATIEFVGIPQKQEVLWIQNGNNHYFKDIPVQVFVKLHNLYQKDLGARKYLQTKSDNVVRQVELYTYYMFGSLDSIPDYNEGELSISENFRETEDCISKKFDFKKFTIGGVLLNDRFISMIDMIKMEYPDKLIADKLNISIKTLDFHKKNLFTKVGCQTKVGLVVLALLHGI